VDPNRQFVDRKSEIVDSSNWVLVALLVASAAVLQVAESFIPYPVPGVRIGLANMVTLIALVRLGRGEAVRISLLRTVIGSVVLGTFLSPTFILSFSGALASALAMAGLDFVSEKTPLRFSLIGISVAGSVSHILAQVVVVYLLFIRTSAVLSLLPWLALIAVGTGLLTGIIALQAARRMQRDTPYAQRLAPDEGVRAYSVKREAYGEARVASLLHRVPAALKVVVTLALAVLVVAVHDFAVYGAVFLVLALLAAVGRVSLAKLACDLRRLALFLALAFLAPVLFTGYGRILLSVGPVRVTTDGLASGGLFAARIIVLFFATSILAWTTTPDAVSRVLGAALTPVKAFGISADRMAAITSLSWSAFPALWDYARKLLTGAGRSKGIRGLAGLSSDLVAELYLEAERMAGRTGGKPPLL